jgi:hypothetical protein
MSSSLEACWFHDIITVVPARNTGKHGGSLDKLTPQKHGSPFNALITVGGVNNSGVLWTGTSFDGGEGGSINVYVVSKDVYGASFTSNNKVRVTTGTSMASPAVAGLAAYFASLPSLASEWKEGSVAKKMKDYIIRHAYERAESPIPKPLPNKYPKNFAPGPIKVAYNRAPDGLRSGRRPPADTEGST